MDARKLDRFSRRSIAAGAVGGLFFALAVKYMDATPCCGGVRQVIDLSRVPLGLFLFGFALVQTTRGTVNLFLGRWRRMLSFFASVAAIPAVLLALTIPIILDPDYWWMRNRSVDLEREIFAKTQQGEYPLIAIKGRDISGGFVTAPTVFKRIVYDASDEIAKPDAIRSEVWKKRAADFFYGCYGKISRGERIISHFYIVYDGC